MAEITTERGFLSVGQAAARTIALRAAQRGMLHRTLLVHGPRGAGLGPFVDDLLALLLCASPDQAQRPCNACAGCRGARGRSHPDLVIGSPERWRELKGSGESIVAAARRWLAESAGAPVAAERRILLIEGVDRAGEQIQNALLKALEEPGPRQMFILVVEDVGSVLSTIRSRSQPLRLGPVPREELAGWLVDHERLPADQADMLARLAGGRSEAAIAMARDPALITWRRQAQLQLLGLLERGPADRFAVLRDLLDDATAKAPAAIAALGGMTPSAMASGSGGAPTATSEEPDEPAGRTPASQQRAGALLLVDVWSELARDLLLLAGEQPQLALAGDVLDGAADAARRAGQRAMAVFLRLLERIRDGLDENGAPRLAMEVAMLAWPRLGPAAARVTEQAGAAASGHANGRAGGIHPAPAR